MWLRLIIPYSATIFLSLIIEPNFSWIYNPQKVFPSTLGCCSSHSHNTDWMSVSLLKFILWILIPCIMASGSRVSSVSQALISDPTKRSQRILHSLYPMRTQWKDGCLQIRKKVSWSTESSRNLISISPASRTERNKCLLFKGHGIVINAKLAHHVTNLWGIECNQGFCENSKKVSLKRADFFPPTESLKWEHND